jgi:hypothetical protein
LMSHCCAIDNTLLVIQYNTRPAGKKILSISRKIRIGSSNYCFTLCSNWP